MRNLRDFYEELRQRKVFKVASIYLVSAWGAALGASELLPNFGAPDWVVRALVIGLLLLFPVVVGLAWFFEVTQDGVVRDPRDLPAPEGATRHSGTTASVPAPTLVLQGLEVIWVDDQGLERRRTFSRPFSAGRDSECEVSTLDPIASRKHARFEPEDGSWFVTDLGSSNGTLVDDERITRQRLPQRCQVRLGPGGQLLQVRVLSRDAETMVIARADA